MSHTSQPAPPPPPPPHPLLGGLSMFDFVLAVKLDVIDVDYSPKWIRTNYPDPEAAA